MSIRNARFLASVHALQVTSATEGVLQCMRYIIISCRVIVFVKYIIFCLLTLDFDLH